MDDQKTYHYDAFLSYSRKDVEIAQQLSRRIRRYIPPKSIGLNKRQLKVFRDTERLTAAVDLTDNLKEQLLTSQYLVLLCSPNTAASNWVDKEVQAFLDIRNIKFIIFVLISGDFNNCLPPTLNSIEGHPLYIDLTGTSKKKFRTESLRLIAALYNVDFMSLFREDEARRRRIIRQVTLTAALFVFALISIYLVQSVDPVYWNQIKQPEFGNANHLIDVDPVHEIAINKKEPSNILYLTRRTGSSDDSPIYNLPPAEMPAGFDLLAEIFLKNKHAVTQVAAIKFEQHEGQDYDAGDLKGTGMLNIWGVLNDKEKVRYIRSFTYQGKDTANNNKSITISPTLVKEDENPFNIGRPAEKLIKQGLLQNDWILIGTLTNFADGQKTRVTYSPGTDYLLTEGYGSAEDAYGPEYNILSNMGNPHSLNIKRDSASANDDRAYWNKIAASPEWLTYHKPLDTIFITWPNEDKGLLTREDCQAIGAALPDTNKVKDLENLLFDSKIEYRGILYAGLLTTQSSISSSEIISIYADETFRHDDPVTRLLKQLVRFTPSSAWRSLVIPSEHPVGIWPLDTAGNAALLLTEDKGFFLTSDKGTSWKPANFREGGFTDGSHVHPFVLAEDAVYAFIDRGKADDRGENPLYRLQKRNWWERWRLGIIQLLQ